MFDRAWVFTNPATGGGPIAIPVSLELPGGEPSLEICAWRTNFGGGSSSPPVVLVYGEESIGEIQGRLVQGVSRGILLIVPQGGVAAVPYDWGENSFTVAWASSSGGAAAPDVVQVRIYQTG